MTKFADSLESGKFVVTCELNPPKGVDLDPLLGKAEKLGGPVTAFNITDSSGSNMKMAPVAASHRLIDMGLEPILQITGRDRNKLALQSDLLAASSLGVANVLCMSGDPPGRGDHPDATAVGDLDAIGLLRATATLSSGKDLAGNSLKGAAPFFAGAVANPGADDMDKELARLESKIEAGAAFFQTQAVFDIAAFEKFMIVARPFNIPVLAGIIVLKSDRMARNIDDNLPGVSVPQEIIQQLVGSTDSSAASVDITARIIREIRDMCGGVHIMAMGWESRIPEILEAAGIPEGR